MALAAFGLIIAIWSHTVAESLALSRIPNFPDIVVPFVAGALELYLNHALGAGLVLWLAGAAAISLFLLVAYPIIEGLARGEPENQAVLAHLGPQRQVGVRRAIGGLVLNVALLGTCLVAGNRVEGLRLGAALLTLAWVGATLAHEARYFGLVNRYARLGR